VKIVRYLYQLFFFKNKKEIQTWYSSKPRDLPKVDPIGAVIPYDNPIDIGHEILISEPFVEKFHVPEWVKNMRTRFVVCEILHVFSDKMEKPITNLHLIPTK
jgi:hypothetical protein